MMAENRSKELAAREALKLVRSGMTLGLGTGSTATFFIEQLGEALSNKSLVKIACIPTSIQSEQLARSLQIPLVDFSKQHPVCDLTVDGADEIDDRLNLIKGLGGALLREKIVAQNSRQLIIIADESKRVSRLGSRCPLPVEVARFGQGSQELFLRSLGCEPVLRMNADRTPYMTDNGNLIFDCHFKPDIGDPLKLSGQLNLRAGVVDHGLFLRLATRAFIGLNDGSVEMIQ